ncbi:MAG: PaaI family thioesterase [Planctomycetaceae bacterium]|nr:PaaI family thioesterase [Planctomycetaceae bacterium]
MNSDDGHFPAALKNGEFPFLDLLEVEVQAIDPGTAVLKLQVDEKHLRSLGIVHGGVTSALLDTALGVAGASHAPKKHHAVTMQLNINFTRIAKQGDLLTTTGRAVHFGSRTAVCQGEVLNQNGEMIASASSTIMFLPLPD